MTADVQVDWKLPRDCNIRWFLPRCRAGRARQVLALAAVRRPNGSPGGLLKPPDGGRFFPPPTMSRCRTADRRQPQAALRNPARPFPAHRSSGSAATLSGTIGVGAIG